MSKSVRWVLHGVVLLVTVAWSCGEASQWLLRSRTQRLLHDLNELHLGEESSAHFQEFQTRWSRWGLKSDFTPSTAGDYSFRVQITSGFAPHNGAIPQKLRDLLWLMRLWPNGVIAHVNLHGGKVASKNLLVVVNTWDNQLLMATIEMEKIADEPSESRTPALLVHPNHDVQWLQGGIFTTRLTAAASPAERQRLWDLRFECFTALRNCGRQDYSRVAPAAYEEYVREQAGRM